MAQLEGDDMRQGMPRFQGEHFNANLKLIEPFKQIAKEQGCSMAQLALAWVLAQEDGTLVPIPGTKHVKYLEENAAAAEVVLPPDVIEACNELINEKTVSGHRYNDKQMASIDTEPDN